MTASHTMTLEPNPITSLRSRGMPMVQRQGAGALFRNFPMAGTNGNSGEGTPRAWLGWLCMAVAAAVLLPSCGAFPVSVVVENERGSVGYSSKGGVVVRVGK